MLGVSGGPGGKNTADIESSAASGPSEDVDWWRRRGQCAVEVPAAGHAASGFSAGAAADWSAAAEWSAEAPLSAAATGADQGMRWQLQPPAKAAAVLATAAGGEAAAEDGRCMRRKSALSTEVDLRRQALSSRRPCSSPPAPSGLAGLRHRLRRSGSLLRL